MELAGPVDVVGVGALAREEAEILLAAHSSADTEIAHEPTLCSFGKPARPGTDTSERPTLPRRTASGTVFAPNAEGERTLDPDAGKPFDQSPCHLAIGRTDHL